MFRMCRSHFRWLMTLPLWAALLFLAACGGSGESLPTVQTVQLNDKGPISRSLTVTLSHSGTVEVDYWTANETPLRVQGASPGNATQEIALPRLRASSTYHYEVSTTTAGVRSLPQSAGSFQTGELPDDVKSITMTSTGQPSQPLTFLAVRSQFTGGVVFDAEGHIVWYGRTSVAPQGATRRANGNWVILLDGVGLAEFSPVGEQVRFFSQSRMPTGTRIHHGVTPTASNTLLFLAFEYRTFGSVALNGESIWEWNPQDDSLVKRWSAFDFLDPAVDFGPRSLERDWFHANSIVIGQHDNIIVSFHFLDQILSIRPDFSAIEWRLGGPGSTYTVSSEQATSGQHSARETAPDTILMFDNGFARNDGGRFSRALELKLDSTTQTASTHWQYRPNPDIWASVISSVRRLANGNTVLTFGTPAGLNQSTGPISLHEVSPRGDLLWNAIITLPSGSVFQGDPIQSVGGETRAGSAP